MTFDDEALDSTVIQALRREAEQDRAPSAARSRVALRLAAGAGVLGLSVSAVGATEAAAATGALASGVGTAAVASGSGLLGVGSVLGFAKAFAVGIGLGAGVGLGLHVASDAGPRPASHDEVRLAGGTPSASPVPRRAPVRVGSPTARAAEPEPAKAADEEAQRAGSARPGPRSTSSIDVNPAPELPLAPSPVTSRGGSLSEQQALLDEAGLALRRGQGAVALGAVNAHVARFPYTAFEEERQLVAIKALVLLGRAVEARAQAERFEARFPRSLLLSSVHAAVAALGSVRRSVTEPPLAPQSTGR